MYVHELKAAERRNASIKERLRTWWQGVDDGVPVEQRTTLPVATPAEAPKPQTLAAPLAPWENPEMRIAQLLWGEGSTRPGGSDYVLGLAKPLGLDPSMSLIEFGAGLGGGARAIHKTFGAWVTAYEPDANLARAAKELSVMAGVDKKATIIRYTPDGFEPRLNAFDAALSAETLFQIAKKEDLLGKLYLSLKPRGQLIITDFVLGNGVSADDPRLNAFSRTRAFFWSADQYAQLFRGRGFDLRINEDITAKYRQMIIDGSAKFTKNGPILAANTKAYPEAVMAQMDIWARRVAAFDSGLIKVMRFSAIKLSRTKLLSDW